MPTYIALTNWTDQGARAIADSPGRLDAAKKQLESLGGQVRAFYMTMGKHDMVLIYDAPDDATAARLSLMLARAGNVRTKTLKAFSEQEYRQIIGALG